MADNTNQNSGFSSGFVGGGWGQPMPPPPPPPQQQAQQPVPPPQPVQPVQQPVQQAPMQPAYDYGQAPMAGMMGIQPQGAGMQGGAAPMGAGAPAGPANDPNYMFGEKMKNFTTTVVLPKHELKFDEPYFIKLLAGSISLSREEKKKIIDSIPKLRQQQVDELIRIFEEERVKFIELSPKHSAQLKKLENEHAADWRDLEMAIKADTKKHEEQNKADEIRKQLGL